MGNPTLTSAMTYWRMLLSLYADRLVSLRWPKGKVIGSDKMSLKKLRREAVTPFPLKWLKELTR